MQNKVTVTIDGQEYNLVASEDAAYMKKVADRVDQKIREVKEGGKVSSADAAVLAALNVADEYFKSLDAAEALRAQIKEYLEESAALKLDKEQTRRIIEGAGVSPGARAEALALEEFAAIAGQAGELLPRLPQNIGPGD